MARGRKSEKIGRITKRDGESMKCMAHTKVISRANMKEYFKVNDRRIDLLVKNNYIKEYTATTKTGMNTYYTLDKNGLEFIRERTDIDTLYRGNIYQLEHDLKLSQVYCQLDPTERQYWLNEGQIIDRWDKISNGAERITGIDAVVMAPGGTIAIEVTTRNYGEQEIQEKIDAAAAIGCERVVMVNA
ncbi:MAG: hypothetical protein ACRC3Y_09680 [Romboutsia sp.]|uniref:hypothetical protein n=1 Tax=Romboutsia sp. TaxID=1965302 RepID=UPI003F3CF0DC